ncbi:hypothetical protein FZI85_06195 [Mycobacterium sp. CBMA293]|uniref:hypothetical protein n=1 Tax=unclassified Mycolicibacterium TaxID=2636767 RepID=UPI0012DFB95D|nr:MULTISPECIES: hypothetical protein [unclassified Mycolicibacterium]MUL45162.1 hypothetical protein [Mycolicibacterium sp. CBMA 360]MUL56680.1 hypothetical protein [Mycolicibacterium sp. CBMA 335]MUL69719.1 hypothetical protein [Mycolicibacterium sp. CBMA 311]MUL91767.1 hypothetical protein [Mycolicibacterium sp. CBMA 230]MUM05506.1 hypothetical protein [Mycolicibacterium sp. CBMA 213]
MAEEPPDNVQMLRSVAKAAESGDERESLLALRDRLYHAVFDPKCSARDLAPLTRRLQEVSKELQNLDSRREREAGDGPSDEPCDERDL